MANTVAARKQKGRILQQETVDAILAAFPSLTENDVRSIPGSVAGTDVWLSEAASKLFFFAVECKNQESIQIWKALAQAEKRRSKDKIPLLVFRRNRNEAYAALKFADFMALIASANKEKVL